ncbi:MAG: PIG-L family deacetylase [Bryobacteraceae bacterium]
MAPLFGQRELSGAAETKLALDRLNVTASVLMIAAHPDDENTALLAYLSRGRKVRTGYLSLTRGEGGQNLIGSEQGDALGVIRTQELLAARRIDGAEQFFTRAIDFGFTKTTQETFEKWGHEKILSDVVWVIRRFRPDVIVLRFSGTPRDGHGQHQASAILGKEAFTAAADRAKFPEQLKWVEPWQAKRLMWNVFSFNREQERDAEKLTGKIEVDPGDFDPVLGHSYGEIAGMSRSLHKSQGMGAPERKGSQKNYLVTVAGEPAAKDILDGIDKTWDSIPGAGKVGQLLAGAAATFQPEHPEKTVPLLLQAEPLMAALNQPLAKRKHGELLDAIALASGLWLDAASDRYAVMPGGTLKFTATALNRESIPVELEAVRIEGIARCPASKSGAGLLPQNTPRAIALSAAIAPDQPYTQPYWLREPKQGATYTVLNQLEIGLPEDPPLFEAHFHLRAGGDELEFVRPVVYRHVDRVQGELTRPIVVEPPVAIEMPEKALVFADPSGKPVEVQVRANTAGQSGKVQLSAPAGWAVEPASREFQLNEAGQETVVGFQVTPPRSDAKAVLSASADVGGRKISVGVDVIAYSHIPPQTLFPPAEIDMARADIRLLAKSIGYIVGAGDDVPEALRQLGASVTLLGPEDLVRGGLGRFDAIVTGVRAYNTRPDLRANQQHLLEYVKNGGTMVVQYNVLEGGFGGGDPSLLAHIGPYPITIGRERVTVEDAPVILPHPDSPLLQQPNLISDKDFAGWVQERGLYFASEWDPRYTPLIQTGDPGEKPLLGGTLYTKYGKGAYVFTAFSWFRELPAGVPGAFRIFANLLSAGKTL